MTTTASQTSDTEITIAPTGDLYHRYSGQTSAQPCYVELDCSAHTLRDGLREAE